MSESPATRVSLILRLRNAADERAWDEFVEIYQPLIIRLAQKKGLQQADALDLSQDVLARVARSIKHWDPNPQHGSFRGWISRITRNLVVDFMRKAHRQPWTADQSAINELVQLTCDSSIESQWFDLERERQIFAWAADKIRPAFSETTWQAFWLTAVESKSVDEVAMRLGIRRGAVYVARSRVMARLKKVIDQSQFGLFEEGGTQ